MSDRKIVSNKTISQKDPNGIYQAVGAVPPPTAPPPPKRADVELDALIAKQLLILARETKYLAILSAQGLLPKDASASLERVMKLTRDLRRDEKSFLEGLTDEELEKYASED